MATCLRILQRRHRPGKCGETSVRTLHAHRPEQPDPVLLEQQAPQMRRRLAVLCPLHLLPPLKPAGAQCSVTHACRLPRAHAVYLVPS